MKTSIFGRVVVRADPDQFDVEHRDPGVGHSCFDVCNNGWVGEVGKCRLLVGYRRQTQTHVVVTGLGGDVDHSGRSGVPKAVRYASENSGRLIVGPYGVSAP